MKEAGVTVFTMSDIDCIGFAGVVRQVLAFFKNIDQIHVSFDMDEITYIAKDKVTLEGEDKETFEKLLTMLDEVEDVQHVYHNVEL